MKSKTSDQKKNKRVRFVTATSLFDGHDAAINIIRRILQQEGAEVIHLGHNRSVREIVSTAIQEGVQGIAVSSYQGGHMEFFKYMKDLLDKNGVGHIKIFGGGRRSHRSRGDRGARGIRHREDLFARRRPAPGLDGNDPRHDGESLGIGTSRASRGLGEKNPGPQ